MSPTQEVIDIWESIRKDTPYNHIFEIGLNAGHSAAINLELFSDVKVTSIDIGRHNYTEVAANILKEKFEDRFDYQICDSRAYYQRTRDGVYPIPQVDIVFIDGGHEFKDILNDIALTKLFGVRDVLIDDTNTDKVGFVCNKFTEMELWTPIKEYKYQWIEGKKSQLTHYRF